MEKTALKRSFSFNGLKLPEPDERMTVEEVKAFYANQYPDLGAQLAVLAELDAISRDRRAKSRTELGRFCQCRHLQNASALLAKAVQQCEGWRNGTRLIPPAGSLPPI